MEIKEITGGICSIKSIKTNGYKEGKYGVSVIYHEDLTATAVYTSNKIQAAPLDITRNHLENGKISAVLINSGNANCYTKKEGVTRGLKLAKIVADYLKIDLDDIAVSSTGVIGRQLPLDILEPITLKTLKSLENSEKASINASKAIMTTDTVNKEYAVEVNLDDGTVFKVAGICKGSGMIAPNMGTLLSFIITDLDLTQNELQEAIKKAVNKSFNMIVIDGDESTNDTCLLMSTNEVKAKCIDDFQKALDQVCITLAKMIAKDGEGATKYLEAKIQNAKTKDDAINASKTIVKSSLVKSAVFGADPNWGRIIDAVGYSKVNFDPDKISISIGSENKTVIIVDHGNVKTYSDPKRLIDAESIMKEENIIITVDLNNGNNEATSFGCDLTYDYVKINAEYTT